MLLRIKEYISTNRLIEENETIILGVSGGVDSVVLFHLFKMIGVTLVVAHCNFQLRGVDADGDALFVQELAEKNNIPFYNIKFDTQKFADENGISIQMAARALRFEWFNDLCTTLNYSKIAIASNLDDSIETCLINLTKGTGLKGLHGILPRQGNVVHPLLFATKQEIIEYAATHKLNFRIDKSNNETKYTRNKIRHQIIPVLKEINPSLEKSFDAFFERIKSYENIVNDYLLEFKKRAVSINDTAIKIDNQQLLNLAEKETVLFEIIYPYGFNEFQVKQILDSLNKQTGKRFYAGKHQLITSSDKIILSPLVTESLNNEIAIPANVSSITSPVCLSFTRESPHLETNQAIACLDYNLLSFPLIIRKWKIGDKFKPLGMKGNKKLSDFFTDNKLSIFEKENIFVLTSNEKIVWVIGYRINDAFKVSENTKSQFTIKLLA